MISRLLGPVGLEMCLPPKALLPSHICLYYWISKTDNAQEEVRAILPFTIVPNGKETR